MWLSTSEAAKLLRAARALVALINEWAVPACRIGQLIRLKSADVDSFVEQARIEPSPLS